MRFLILLWISLLAHNSQGQPPQSIDSLEVLLHQTTSAYKKSELLNQLAIGYLHKDIDQAIDYIKQAIYIIPSDKQKEQAQLYNTLGGIYGHKNDIDNACLYLDSASMLYQELGNLEGVAMTCGNLGTLYSMQDRYDIALKYIYKSIRIHEKLENNNGIAHNLTALAAIYSAQDEVDKALENEKKALTLYNPKDLEALGGSNFNIGSFYLKKDVLDSALIYYPIALSYYQKSQNLEGCALVYRELSTIYRQQSNIDSAIVNLNRAVELQNHISAGGQKIDLKQKLANLHFDNNNHQKSIVFFQESLLEAQNLKLIRYERDALGGLIKNYVALKEFEKAHLATQQLMVIKDSILNSTKQKQIKELEIQYETAKKEQENTILKNERTLLKLDALRHRQLTYAALIILALVLISAYFYIRQYRAFSIKEAVLLKHRLLRNQMNPHFIFNALIAIQSFVYENAPKQAGKYIASFAKLVRAILENSREEYITLSKEVQWLENYLNLQALRFEHEFDYSIEIDEQLHKESVLIPPMLTQPFIENALEHGLQNIQYRGLIKVYFKQLGNLIQISVEDNGIGFSESTTPKAHTSLATQITKERLEALNKNSSKKVYFELSNLEQGAQVTFSIPLKQKD